MRSRESWIRKNHSTFFNAKKEQITQEFYRLIIPRQPKTRFIREEDEGYFLSESEEVAYFAPLPRDSKNLFSNGVITGLGEVLLLGLFLCEMNLNERHIGLNRHREVIKLDGQHCFDAKGHTLTVSDIEALPFLDSFQAEQWVEFEVDAALSNTVQFRLEVNRTILALCLLTHEFVFHFFKAYLPEVSMEDPSILFIIQRQKELVSAALRNVSFRHYVLQEKVQQQAQDLLKSLMSFKTSDNQQIFSFLDSNYSLLMNKAKQQFKMFMQTIDLERKLIKISTFPAGPDDQLLRDFVVQKKKDIHDAIDSPTQMTNIDKNLTCILSSVSSKEVLTVKYFIDKLNARFWRADHLKAHAIEAALMNTPLEARGAVVSEKRLNNVQRALATHTSFWKKHKIYQTQEQSLDYDKAAKSYQKAIDGVGLTHSAHL